VLAGGKLTDANGFAAPAPSSFYLCGWKNMIDETKQLR